MGNSQILLIIAKLPSILTAAALFAQQPGDVCRQGADLFQRGELEQARAVLERAVRQQPTAYCWKVLGVVHAAGSDYRRAEPAFAEACRANAKEPEACYFWARALYSLDRFDESLKALDRAAGSTAKAWRVRTARGQAFDALGRAAEAEEEFIKALAQRRQDADAPAEPEPLIGYTAFLYRQGRIDDAMKRLRGAPPAFLRLAAYHYQLGRALAQQEKWEDAAEALRNAVSLQSDYAEAHGLLSRVYYRQGKNDLAAEHARRALQGSVTSR